ncbi:MAG: Nitroreductase [Frankiales bacterium]|nr:Nitroreductase [Frankiales bacterium]
MELKDAIRLRRSGARITAEAPDDVQLAQYLALAAHSPDHAALRPWRLVTLRGADRERLGAALVAGFGDEPGSDSARRTAGKATRAPLLLGIVAAIQDHPKVPEWEQVAAVVAMVTTLELVLFDAGWTAMWRSGPGTEMAPVKQLMGVGPSEKILGWLYIGATDPDGRPGPEQDPDLADRITALA